MDTTSNLEPINAGQTTDVTVDSAAVTPAVGAEEFSRRAEESRATIEDEKSARTEKRDKKRGRGRPRKAERAPKTRTAIEGAPSAAAEKPVPPSEVLDIKPLIVPPLVFISRIPAQKTQIPELALSPDEAMLCAASLENLLNVFVPDVTKLDPKTAAVIGTCTTFGSIGLSKYAIYLDRRSRVPQDPSPATPEASETAPEKVKGAVSAKEYFG